jgi:hypothetical protein
MKPVYLNPIAAALIAVLSPVAAQAQAIDLTPRSPLEAVVLGEPEAAKAQLTTLAKRGTSERAAVVADLLAAGFLPDRGSPGCDFYGYYRRTTADGAARSVQIALCDSREPMVLFLDFFAPSKPGPSFQATMKEQQP